MIKETAGPSGTEQQKLEKYETARRKKLLIFYKHTKNLLMYEMRLNHTRFKYKRAE